MNYRILSTLLLSVITLSVQAETRWFEVELLVFERNADVKDMKEQLSSDPLFVDTRNSISILKPNKSNSCLQAQVCLSEPFPAIINGAVFDYQGNNFKYLGSSGLQLAEQRRRLASHAGFNPVFHMAWRMPISGPQQSKAIHLFAGENFAFKYPDQRATFSPSIDLTINPENGITSELTNSTIDSSTNSLSPAINQNPDKWAIDGNFKIYLNHFLYIDSQLIIRKEMTQEITQAKKVVEVINDENGVQIANQVDDTVTETQTIKKQVLKEILFDQNRRLRSEEIHYLDHPLMGIIVQIRKI